MRRYRSEILAEWRLVARQLPVARDMNPVTLVDHIPDLLDEIADIAEELAAQGDVRVIVQTARNHALDRLAQGFDVTLVVRELSMLRGAAMTVWGREVSGGNVAELRALDLAIDRAITISVARYIEAHSRILRGIDRISTASLAARSIDELLHQLLSVFLETTPAVDTAAVLLLDTDGRLRMRASVGLEEDVDSGLSFAVGEGFAGTIAERAEAIELRGAYMDSLVTSEAIHRRGVRALYGLPLVHEGTVIGVVYMGSQTAAEFSPEDRHFLASLATRATMGITQHILREQLAHSEHRLRDAVTEKDRALAKLESLLAASTAGIAFLDRDLRYLRVNTALAEINGRPVEAHIGRTVAEVLPQAVQHFEPLLRRVLDTGEPIRNLEVTDPSSGRTFLLNYFPVPGPSGVVAGVGGHVVDVTDLKRIHEEVRREQQRTQSIIDHCPAAIWVKDPDGRIVIANRRLADALGTPYEGMIGRRSNDILPPDIARQHEEHDQIVVTQQRAIEVEETVPSATGARTFLSIKFPIPGTPMLIGGIGTEITDRKRIEEELRMAVRTREDILAIVSHDLRTPLGTIQLSATMMLGQLGTDPRWRRHLEMIQRASQRMEALIDDLLDTANIRARRLQLELKAEAAVDVVREALDIHRPVVEDKGIAFARRCDIANVEIQCDRNRILQVFGNLIGNAVKFCRPGDTITVTCARDGDEMQVSITDTGPGMPPDVASKIFEPYWSATQHVKLGAGLGLYIAKGIIEGHGGRLWVESTPGHGATFSFTLPVAG